MNKGVLSAIREIYIVYKAKDGSWRGFCHPYNISCEAGSESEAKKRIEDLAIVHRRAMNKYSFPKKMMSGRISNSEDRKMFEVFWKNFTSQKKSVDLLTGIPARHNFSKIKKGAGKYKLLSPATA